MSRNGSSTLAPSCKMLIVPPFSTMKSRSSPACAIDTGDEKPPATSISLGSPSVSGGAAAQATRHRTAANNSALLVLHMGQRLEAGSVRWVHQVTQSVIARDSPRPQPPLLDSGKLLLRQARRRVQAGRQPLPLSLEQDHRRGHRDVQ